jgi:hypothetical protein
MRVKLYRNIFNLLFPDFQVRKLENALKHGYSRRARLPFHRRKLRVHRLFGAKTQNQIQLPVETEVDLNKEMDLEPGWLERDLNKWVEKNAAVEPKDVVDWLMHPIPTEELMQMHPDNQGTGNDLDDNSNEIAT